jgi:hypothetical protein
MKAIVCVLLAPVLAWAWCKLMESSDRSNQEYARRILDDDQEVRR